MDFSFSFVSKKLIKVNFKMNLKLFATPPEPISPPLESCQGCLAENILLPRSGGVFPKFLLSLLPGDELSVLN